MWYNIGMDKESLNGLVVVYKRAGKFFTGGIKNGKVVRYRPIKKLTDLKHRDSYVTLAAYLKEAGKKDKPDTLLASLKVERLYILQDKPKGTQVDDKKLAAVGAMTEKAWEKAWWSAYYPLCVSCTKDCKQSHMIVGLICPTRVAVKK